MSLRNHMAPYPPALGCDEALNSWCNRHGNCPHSALLARFDRESLPGALGQSVRAWRCYAPSTLDEHSIAYVRGTAFCTRENGIDLELRRCVASREDAAAKAASMEKEAAERAAAAEKDATARAEAERSAAEEMKAAKAVEAGKVAKAAQALPHAQPPTPRPMATCGGPVQACEFVELQSVSRGPLLSHEALLSCLENKRIFIGGNSVARHWAFVLLEALINNKSAGHRLDRQPQRHVQNYIKNNSTNQSAGYRRAEQATCGRGDHDRADNMAACKFTAGRNTTITFGWVQRVRSVVMERAWEAGTDADIVVLGSGSDDIFDPKRLSSWQQAQEQEAPLLARMLQKVLASRDAPLLYWRTISRVCPPAGLVTSAVLEQNKRFVASSSGLLSQLCHSPSSSVAGLRVLDLSSWTQGACASYDDSVHHSVLAFQHVQTWMLDACNVMKSQQSHRGRPPPPW